MPIITLEPNSYKINKHMFLFSDSPSQYNILTFFFGGDIGKPFLLENISVKYLTMYP